MDNPTTELIESTAVLLAAVADAGHTALDNAALATLLGLLGVSSGGVPHTGGMRIALSNTREFGPVLSAGLGGAEAALANGCFGRDRAEVSAAAELVDAGDFLALFRRTFAYRRFADGVAAAGTAALDAALEECFAKLLALAKAFSPANGAADQLLDALVLDPVAPAGDGLVVGAASCQVGTPAPGPLPRPVHKIGNLLHPRSIGIIGVSASKMNFGRIILNNIIDSGYPAGQMAVIRPGGGDPIDGVRCVDGLQGLDGKLDLFIVAVTADQVYGLVDEIIAADAAESVMLIPGGLGETAVSREPAAAMAARINSAHGNAGGGPVFLGANCLGVVSHPGKYDSWFIPLERLPKPAKRPDRNSVLISQSGAFMITRLSRNPWLDPRYMLAIGNQTDLTHGDLISYFADLPEIRSVGVYIEGFRDLDGLTFARAVRRAVLAGKQVVVYKSGKSEPGRTAAKGHTASIAGDWELCEAVLRQAGAIVADEITRFDDLLYMAGALEDKTLGGQRLGAISGAGFEAVSMADSIHGATFSMAMGEFTPETAARVSEILAANRLDALVEVRNPIDINPGADDAAHLDISEAFAADPNIDAVVVGLDPTAPSVRALESSAKRPGFDLDDPKSTANLMPGLVARSAKPIIGVVDGGPLYDALAARLMDRGVCVFRTCSRAVEALVRYSEARLDGERLRARYGTRSGA